MMKLKFFLFIIICPLFTFSQFSEKKIYDISKISSPLKIKIDGVFNDLAWQDINLANDFIQLSPNNGAKERPNQKTEVKLCYDDKYLYIAAKLLDNAPDSILKELSSRDDKQKNCDLFAIYLNPYNNGQMEYSFAVTAAGVQIDSKISSGNEDQSWNAVWNSSVKINKEGWNVEIAIPFSSLRFPDNNKSWALNIARTIRRYREDYSWNPIDVSFQNYSIQSGLLDGIKNINSPIRLSFMPYSSLYFESYNGIKEYPNNFGMDLKYGINESFTLDMTLVPDFGQAASDAQVLNLSPFEVKYEEKRQFFNEGIELFNIGGEMFYSRRVQDDLLNATKISGRTNKGLGIATLNAVTNKTDDKPLTNFNVLIFDKALKNNSSISFMNTHMVQNGPSRDANVSGLFAKINNEENTRVFGANLKLSQEFEGANITRGFAGMLAVGKTSGKYQYELFSSFEDDKYNPNDLGFLYSNNSITNGINLGYFQTSENKRFINSDINLQVRHETLFTDNKFTDLNLELESKVTLKRYLTIFARIKASPYEEVDYYEARTNNLFNPLKRSKYIYIGSWVSSDYRKKIAIDIGGGGAISPLYSGYMYRLRISPRIRFNDKLSLRYILSIKNRYNDIGFVKDTILENQENYEPIFGIRNTYMVTNVLSASYIVNNKISFNLKLRYHLDQVENLKFKTLDDNGYLNDVNNQLAFVDETNINYSTWTSDINFSWWFAPGSQVKLVWKNAVDNQTNLLRNNWSENIEDSFNLPLQNSVSLKVIYYLDYLYFKRSKK
jgi:hypothetical protein